MNPNVKGWFKQVCTLVDPADIPIVKAGQLQHDELLYRLLQPSGLLYGHPVREIGTIKVFRENLDPVGRMKLIFTEALLRTGSLNLKESHPTADLSQLTEHLVPEISTYLLNLYPDLYHGKQTSYLQNPYYMAETLIGKRISVKTSMVRNYLANLFHNSLLFLDVYFFGEWVKGLGSASTSYFREEKARMRLTTLGLMALAAKADRRLQSEEKALFEFFLQSADLSPELQKEARLMLTSLEDPADIDIPPISSWLLKKYLMEMAILVTWADKEMNEPEHKFIEKLGEQLKFSPEEVSESILAVESFVLGNWSAMYYLLGKHDMEKIGNRFIGRLKGIVYKNKDYLVQEIRESKELFYLLGKSRSNTLTDDEKRIVNEQLVDIFKTVPVFIIIALPFTFITLPTLISLLPRNAFPSAFQE